MSSEAEKALLKSEFHDFANIRLSLHVIRLGEVGADTFRQQVEDEDTPVDIELSSGNSHTFKIFPKQLSNVHKQSNASPKRTSNSKLSRQRSSSSSNRNRRSNRPPLVQQT